MGQEPPKGIVLSPSSLVPIDKWLSLLPPNQVVSASEPKRATV